MENPKHFVLVPGICHGAWCWCKLVTLLQHAGHRFLGASGINSKQLHEITSVWDYVQPLMEFMASSSHEERVILVGHSMASFLYLWPWRACLAAVFVTAYMPHYNSPLEFSYKN